MILFFCNMFNECLYIDFLFICIAMLSLVGFLIVLIIVKLFYFDQKKMIKIMLLFYFPSVFHKNLIIMLIIMN